jgi:pyruvate,water dikinase
MVSVSCDNLLLQEQANYITGDLLKEPILWFDDIGRNDIEKVGGKCANLGEIAGIHVPTLPGFAITADAYDHFIKGAGLRDYMKNSLEGLDVKDIRDLRRRGAEIRKRVASARIPDDLRTEIIKAYRKLGQRLGSPNPFVAVRSSATAEDLPGASFAGQQDTYLNVSGEKEMLQRVKDCFASLFTDRAISYRVDKGFDHLKVKLSIGVQKMVRSDVGSSGVMFTMDPDSGFDGVVVINGTYGLGEYLVQGKVTPDKFIVFKKTMKIIEKSIGSKKLKLIRGGRGNREARVSEEDRNKFCITDEKAKKLAEYAMMIEEHYRRPMDIEWAIDGETGELYIVQARPETVHSTEKKNIIREFILEEKGKVIVTGSAVGRKIGVGKVNVIRSSKDIYRFKVGEVLVTEMTDPDWEPIMKIASAIVTDSGGQTSHAAIVSRELGVPCIIGTENATEVLKTGREVTVDCSTGEGRVFRGFLKFRIIEKDVSRIPRTRTKIMLNIGEPSRAFSLAKLPVDGVGLAREEFIISSYVGKHPLYLLDKGKGDVYVQALATGIGKIAAAFYPRPVIVRLSDFKTDEYANLKGGHDYEPKEDNPMLGWRGASRYYDKIFSLAFELECKALRMVREDLKLDNVIIMVPFCRTVEEAKRVRSELSRFGLDRRSGCKMYMMAELPSNVILADEFAKLFDGFSIGSNDLTQLTLGLDRNSDKLNYLFDERNEAVKRLIEILIRKAHRNRPRRSVGICGEAPSNYPDFTEFLVRTGIDSISVEPDVALKTILLVDRVEKKLSAKG